MKRFIEYVTALALTAFVLALTLVAISTLNGKPSTAASSPLQDVTVAPTITEVLLPPTPFPTITPVPAGVTLDWIPTPIPPLEALPKPKQGSAHLTGRVLCNGVPKPWQFVYLVWIDGTSYSMIEARPSDEAGRWLFENVPPITVAVLGEPPKSMPEQVFAVRPDQTTDIGDINLAPSLCK